MEQNFEGERHKVSNENKNGQEIVFTKFEFWVQACALCVFLKLKPNGSVESSASFPSRHLFTLVFCVCRFGARSGSVRVARGARFTGAQQGTHGECSQKPLPCTEFAHLCL